MSRARAHRVSAVVLSAQEVGELTVRKLPRGTHIFRCHSRYARQRSGDLVKLGAWFFSSSNGRFDLEAPRGTLNVAQAMVGAVCESLGVLTLDSQISEQEVLARRLVPLALKERVDLVDFTDRKAAQAAKILAGEMTGAAKNYAEFQSLAKSVDAVGRGGICSFLRFSSPERGRGYFIFGDSGPRLWETGEEISIVPVLNSLGYEIINDELMPVSDVDFRA